jgi:nitrile hydratase accessory protein
VVTALPAEIGEAERLLAETGGPGFAEPWQAQAFACAIQLSRRGVFSWAEWVETFSAEIKANPAQPDETSNAAYYRQWLAALEAILARKGALSGGEIDMRQEEWRRAYLNTPHGEPVELAHARTPPAVGGHHHHHEEDETPKPVAVSPARG